MGKSSPATYIPESIECRMEKISTKKRADGWFEELLDNEPEDWRENTEYLEDMCMAGEHGTPAGETLEY